MRRRLVQTGSRTLTVVKKFPMDRWDEPHGSLLYIPRKRQAGENEASERSQDAVLSCPLNVPEPGIT